MNNKNNKQLRNGCTTHKGIGLKDIIRIRQEMNTYTKPHMPFGVYKYKEEGK